MNVFPHAIALANIHIGTIAGKLNGVIPATTPSGCRIENTSTPRDGCSEKPPLSRWGTPHANSTFSMPLATSPLASEMTFPCSDVMSAARSSRCLSSRSRNAKSTVVRCDSEAARHSRKAPAAVSTAASTSAAEARSTAPVWRPVAGLKTGPCLPEVPSTTWPPIQ
jgi:hypothetical protein